MHRPHYLSPPIEDTLPLFARPAARASDPATSHAAAAQAVDLRSHHQRIILEALQAGPAGASVIAERCGLAGHQVNKRLTELARRGKIWLTGRNVSSASGRAEREWRCV